MNSHEHARLTYARRVEMVRQMAEQGLSARQAAAVQGVTPATARKWLGRFLADSVVRRSGGGRSALVRAPFRRSCRDGGRDERLGRREALRRFRRQSVARDDIARRIEAHHHLARHRFRHQQLERQVERTERLRQHQRRAGLRVAEEDEGRRRHRQPDRGRLGLLVDRREDLEAARRKGGEQALERVGEGVRAAEADDAAGSGGCHGLATWVIGLSGRSRGASRPPAAVPAPERSAR